MSIRTLKDLHLDMLQDIWSADEQARAATEKLVDAASEPRLQEALLARAKDLAASRTALGEIIKSLGAEPSAERCKGMEGLVKEVKAHALELDAPAAVKDAAIIAQYQRMSHYRIAGYGSAVALARQLGESAQEKSLRKHLDDAYAADRLMSEIAETRVNEEAA